MGESIWKKEISFKRKAKDAAEPVVAEQVEQLEQVEPVEQVEQKQSVWKKEISLGRKQKEKEPKAAEPAEQKQSLWKKEVSFGRKQKDAAPEPEPVAAAADEQKSFWKKEVSFSRKKNDDDAVARLVELATKTVAPEFEAAPTAEPVVAPPEVAEAVLAAEPVSESADVHPVELLPVEEPVAQIHEIAPVDVVPPVAEVPPPAVVDVDVPPQVAEVAAPVAVDVTPSVADVPAPAAFDVASPVAEVVAPAVVDAAPPVADVAAPAVVDVAPPLEEVAPPAVEVVYPVAEFAPPPAEIVPPVPEVASTVVEVAPAPAVEIPTPAVPVDVAPVAEVPVEQHVETAPVEQWMEPVAAESWLAEPELPPAPDADTQVVVHPPVPALELPPLPALKQPFWKKELSFGRKSKKQVAAAPMVQAPVAAPGVHPPVPAAELPPLPELKQPFWKKELSFGKKGPKAPKGESQPFWKKDLSLGKGAKAPQAEKAPSAKRGLSFSMPSLSLASFSRGGGGGKGGHQVKRLVGLKVGGSQLAAARVANNGAAELLQLVRADLEPGVVVAGELRDPDTLATALKAFFAANKLPRKNVRLGIASNRIGVRTFEIAGIEDAKQLENAIQFRAQEALPIPLDEAVLDYQILEERVDEEGIATKRVLLVVAYRELVDRYVTACKKAGITLSGIDLEAFALLRALSAPRSQEQPNESALVAVAIGHDRSTFAVSDGRVCEFTRVLEWGGASLNIAIARALDLAPSEAESVKRILSLATPDVPQGIGPEHYALAVDAVRKQVQSFARELVSSLQFYQNQPGSLGIGEIVITGGTANLAGLADELQRLIGVRVRVGDPLARLKVTKKLAFDEPVGSLAVAIGLGIED
jgi:type IV pilus assembly protein PilM